MLRRFLPLLLLALMLSILAACGEQSGGAAPTGATGNPGGQPTNETEQQGETGETTGLPDLQGRKVVVGSDTTYPPMEFIDETTREVQGFDVDMMAEMGTLLNAEFEFQTFPNFDAIFAALAQGQFDVVVSSVSVTEERKEIIAFSDPYLSIGQAIATQQDNTSITSVDSLTEAGIVGVQGGTTGEEAARNAGVPEDRIRRYDTIDLAFQDLANGAIDAVVADGPPVARYTGQFDNLKVVGEPFTTEDYAIALQQGDDELLQAVNAALAEMKSNGTLERLMEKWNLSGVATIP